MAAHLKNEFTEDEKCYNLITWLIFYFELETTETFLYPRKTLLTYYSAIPKANTIFAL